MASRIYLAPNMLVYPRSRHFILDLNTYSPPSLSTNSRLTLVHRLIKTSQDFWKTE